MSDLTGEIIDEAPDRCQALSDRPVIARPNAVIEHTVRLAPDMAPHGVVGFLHQRTPGLRRRLCNSTRTGHEKGIRYAPVSHPAASDRDTRYRARYGKAAAEQVDEVVLSKEFYDMQRLWSYGRR